MAGAALAAAGLAGLARLAYGPGVVGYDGMYALVWGQALARGELPDLAQVTAPTPHPLAIAVAALLAPLGTAAPGWFSALAFLAFGALGVAAFSLGRAFAGPPAGVALAAILLTREVLVVGLLQALIDIPFVALVLAATAAALLRRGPVGVLAPLVLAGLLRPEGWGLAAVAALWLARDAPPRRRPELAAAALAAPVVWCAFDLAATGDPLHSLTATRELTDRLARPTGLVKAAEFAPGHLGDILGGALSVAALAGLAVAAVRVPDRTVAPLAVLAASLAGFLLLGAAGLPLLIRYMLLPAAMLALFAAHALTGWASSRAPYRIAWAAGALAIAAALAAAAPGQRETFRLLATQTAQRRALEQDLRGLVARPAVRRRIAACGPVYAPSSRPAPVIAQRLELPPGTVRSAAYETPRRGLFLSPEPATGRTYLLDPREPHAAPEPPPGFRPVARTQAWLLTARC
ncbi:MAG TPA: hypothetical protein VF533_09420 [Solirubrobacteraceae bacterium]